MGVKRIKKQLEGIVQIKISAWLCSPWAARNASNRTKRWSKRGWPPLPALWKGAGRRVGLIIRGKGVVGRVGRDGWRSAASKLPRTQALPRVVRTCVLRGSQPRKEDGSSVATQRWCVRGSSLSTNSTARRNTLVQSSSNINETD